MRGEAQLLAEFAAKSEAIEGEYAAARDEIVRQLQKAHLYKGAIANYELKLARASSEFEQEIKTIEGNFDAIREGQ